MRFAILIGLTLGLASAGLAQTTRSVCYKVTKAGVTENEACVDIGVLFQGLNKIVDTEMATPAVMNGDGTVVSPAVPRYRSVGHLVKTVCAEALLQKILASLPADPAGTPVQKAKADQEAAKKAADAAYQKAIDAVTPAPGQ